MKYYIKERNNLQSPTYYCLEGKLTAKDARKKENSLAGYNIMHGYQTEKEYSEAIEKLKAEGNKVY